MSNRLTPLLERAVVHYAPGDITLTEALRRAGSKGNRNSLAVSASRLRKNAKFTQAIAEERQRIAEASGITPESALRDTLKLRDDAAKVGQYSAAIKGQELALRQTGLLSPKDKDAAPSSLQAALASVNVTVNVASSDVQHPVVVHPESSLPLNTEGIADAEVVDVDPKQDYSKPVPYEIPNNSWHPYRRPKRDTDSERESE